MASRVTNSEKYLCTKSDGTVNYPGSYNKALAALTELQNRYEKLSITHSRLEKQFRAQVQPIPEKFIVKKIDGTIDFEASLKKALIAHEHLERRFGLGPVEAPEDQKISVDPFIIDHPTPDNTPIKNLLCQSPKNIEAEQTHSPSNKLLKFLKDRVYSKVK